MTFSIHHFFKFLLDNKKLLLSNIKLENFPFDPIMLSCRNKGIFPDLAIRLNIDKSLFTGGELIEIKDSLSFSVASFNSTIPSGSKRITDLINSDNCSLKQQMIKAGNDIYSLPIRDVYYLVRGRKKGIVKVCLVHGSFFETIKADQLISQAFSQALEERLAKTGESLKDNIKSSLLYLFSNQETFSKVRTVDKASVKLRFRIMTEVKAEGNILNSKKYPELTDNTLNFLLPCHDTEQEDINYKRAKIVFSHEDMKGLRYFKIKHHFNGYFQVFQTP